MLHHTYNAMSMRYVRALPSISLCWGDIFFKNRRAAPCSPKGTHLHTQWRHQETTTTAINTMNTTCRIAPNSFYYVEKNVLSSFNVNSEFSHLLSYFKLFCFVGFLRFVCVCRHRNSLIYSHSECTQIAIKTRARTQRSYSNLWMCLRNYTKIVLFPDESEKWRRYENLYCQLINY